MFPVNESLQGVDGTYTECTFYKLCSQNQYLKTFTPQLYRALWFTIAIHSVLYHRLRFISRFILNHRLFVVCRLMLHDCFLMPDRFMHNSRSGCGLMLYDNRFRCTRRLVNHYFLMHHRLIDNRTGCTMTVHMVNKAHMVTTAKAESHNGRQQQHSG